MITTAILRDLGFDLFEVSYTLTDDRGIRELNHRYRNINKTTDVLSFPQYNFYNGELKEPVILAGKKAPLGDIVISMETLKRRNRKNNKKFKDDLLGVIIHAILHLIGFDHKVPRQRKIMREAEKRLFKIYKKEFVL